MSAPLLSVQGVETYYGKIVDADDDDLRQSAGAQRPHRL
jgi:hypothetical protein